MTAVLVEEGQTHQAGRGDRPHRDAHARRRAPVGRLGAALGREPAGAGAAGSGAHRTAGQGRRARRPRSRSGAGQRGHRRGAGGRREVAAGRRRTSAGRRRDPGAADRRGVQPRGQPGRRGQPWDGALHRHRSVVDAARGLGAVRRPFRRFGSGPRWNSPFAATIRRLRAPSSASPRRRTRRRGRCRFTWRSRTLVAGWLQGSMRRGGWSAGSASGLVVPIGAINTDGSEPWALRVTDGKTERVTVTLGLRDPRTERVHVVSGLTRTRYAAARGVPGHPSRHGGPGGRASALEARSRKPGA